MLETTIPLTTATAPTAPAELGVILIAAFYLVLMVPLFGIAAHRLIVHH